MPLSDLSDLITPVVADQLAKFGPGQGGKPSQLNYDVPVPGSYSWSRIVPLDLPAGSFVQGAAQAGTSFLQLGVAQGDQNRLEGIDRNRLAQFYRAGLPVTARPALNLVAQVGGVVEPLLNAANQQALAAPENAQVDLLGRRAILAEPDDLVRQRTRAESYLDNLATREADVNAPKAFPSILLPVPGLGQSIHQVALNPVAPSIPRLALVETWELHSFLGDYGLGRTLQTYSLLPGERTTITVETWRAESSTRDDSSSIFDSSDTAAQTRFTSALTRESGAAFQDQGGWAASVSTSVSAGANFFGIVHGSASVGASFAASHQESSQRWSSSVSQASSEHASQVNNSRRQSVQSSSSSTSSSGTTMTTTRELANTNLRRVLNFVFRELNQTYETYVVLRDIKLAFYNGNPGSAEIVPLSEIGPFIRRHIDKAHWDEVARLVLGLCAQRSDAAGNVVAPLGVGTPSPANPGIFDWPSAQLNNKGELDFVGDPLAPSVHWRFQSGPLSKDSRQVNGVIMDKSTVVLRTDNVVVEALLGQADALDPYASALQALDLQNRESEIEARDVETKRTNEALTLLAAQDADEQIDAWVKLFPDQPEIEVVPVAAVSNSGGSNGQGNNP
jgi:hypothetical protein